MSDPPPAAPATATPGQAEYATWVADMERQDVLCDDWDRLPLENRHAWAVIEAGRDRLARERDEARQALETIARSCPCGLPGCDSTIARQALDGSTVPEVWDASVPPGGYVCSTCGIPVESERCPDHGGAGLEG